MMGCLRPAPAILSPGHAGFNGVLLKQNGLSQHNVSQHYIVSQHCSTGQHCSMSQRA